MSLLATLAAISLSLAALGYLAATDPKRRRAFRLPPPYRRRAGAAWAAALGPGLLLPYWSGGAGFFVWLGAASVAGWILAAVSPVRSAAMREMLNERLLAVRAGFRPMVAVAARTWHRALARALAFRPAPGRATASGRRPDVRR